jgi:ribonuclease/clavin/mitogillin
LFDTGDGQKPEFFLNLKKSLNFDRITLSSIILSHWHEDHVGGVQEVLNVAEVRSDDCYIKFVLLPPTRKKSRIYVFLHLE